MQRIRRRASGISVAQAIRWGWIPLLIAVLSACHLDMYDQPKAGPYEQSDFFKDGSVARPLEPGTIPNNRDVDNAALTTGQENGQFVQQSPVQSSPELLAQGKTQFSIYCSPCHGANGDGKGVASGYFQQRPPSFYLERLRTAPDGYLFDVITHGKGLMYPYNTQVRDVNNRWAIIAFIRDFQQKPPPEGVEANPTEQPTTDPNATPTATGQAAETPAAGTPAAGATPQAGAGTPTATP